MAVTESRADRATLAAALSLGLVVVLRSAWEWRFLDRFLGDHGWYFRVVERVASGEMLYRDVGWDYGPLPVYAVGFLFRISKSLVWTELLDLLLVGLSAWAVFAIAARLTSRHTALWITAWATFLGAAKGLSSFHLEAYTSAVAWGAATSLLTAAAACRWVAGGRVIDLVAAGVLALAAVLSKPEFGLATASVLACALLLRRPPRTTSIVAGAVTAAAVLTIGLAASPSTLHAWWRGYSGYDLIAVGQVAVANGPRLLAALVAAAILGLALWSWPVSLGAAGLAAVFVVHWIRAGRSISLLLDLANVGTSAVWAGAVPALLWLAWRSRGAGVAREMWVVCTYALVVNLRPLLYGDFCPPAAGPMAALALHAVQRGVLRPPPRSGLLVLGVVALLLPAFAEVRSLERPLRAERVDTGVGIARVPPRVASEIREMRAWLDSLPAGPLFVSGWGPCWYLVSGRRNPTRFDGLLDGIGVTEPEVSGLFEDLRSDPPAVVIVERDFTGSASYSHERLWDELGAPYTMQGITRSGRWEIFVAETGGDRTRPRPRRSQGSD